MIGLKLFGELEIRGEAGSIDLAGSKLSALLAVLVVAGGKPVARDSLAEMLWGSHFEEQARQSLRQALTRLRKLLGGDVIVPDDRFVRLRTEMVASDHASFMKLAPSTDAMALREAADLARGEFMAGLALREPGFSDWLAAERRRIEVMLQDVQRRLAHVELEQGDAKGALSRAEAVLARDVLDEEAHRLRVLALAALGRKAEALKAHQAFAEQLRAELGTVTSAETEQLVTQLKAPAPAAEPAGAARPSARLANRVQLTSDGHKAYLEAVEGAFGGDVDYAVLHKVYGASPEAAKGRYGPAECIGTTKNRIEGSPDLDHVSTSYVERHNLTMRMHMRRFTRLTNAFSKKIENHAYAVALHMMYYNFVKVHSKLRVSPAMAAGVSDRLWAIGDIVGLVEAEEAKIDRKRGPYKMKCKP